MLNHCLEWYEWVLNERNVYTPDIGLTYLFHGRGRSVVVPYTLFVWSCPSAPVELSTRCTTPYTLVEIGSTRANVE